VTRKRAPAAGKPVGGKKKAAAAAAAESEDDEEDEDEEEEAPPLRAAAPPKAANKPPPPRAAAPPKAATKPPPPPRDAAPPKAAAKTPPAKAAASSDLDVFSYDDVKRVIMEAKPLGFKCKYWQDGLGEGPFTMELSKEGLGKVVLDSTSPTYKSSFLKFSTSLMPSVSLEALDGQIATAAANVEKATKKLADLQAQHTKATAAPDAAFMKLVRGVTPPPPEEPPAAEGGAEEEEAEPSGLHEMDLVAADARVAAFVAEGSDVTAATGAAAAPGATPKKRPTNAPLMEVPAKKKKGQ